VDKKKPLEHHVYVISQVILSQLNYWNQFIMS